jgi:hypothetical protein
MNAAVDQFHAQLRSQFESGRVETLGARGV